MIYERIKEICNAKGITIRKLEQDLEFGRGSVRKQAAPAMDRSAQIEALQKKAGRLKELFVNELITIDEYKADREMYAQKIEALQAEQQKAPGADAEALEAMRALSKMDISGIYNDLTTEERRRFWRGIIRTIWVGKDRSIRVEFLAISAGNN